MQPKEKLKVYIASKFASRVQIMKHKRELQAIGFEVLSTWMEPEEDTLGADFDSLAANLDESKRCAVRDLKEISQCDIFIIDTTYPANAGGRTCEVGAVLYRQLYEDNEVIIYRVGPITNVFHALASPIKDWEAMIEEMRRVYGHWLRQQ